MRKWFQFTDMRQGIEVPKGSRREELLRAMDQPGNAGLAMLMRVR